MAQQKSAEKANATLERQYKKQINGNDKHEVKSITSMERNHRKDMIQKESEMKMIDTIQQSKIDSMKKDKEVSLNYNCMQIVLIFACTS